MRTYIPAAVVLASWIGNGVYCFRIAKRAWALPTADEEELVAGYNRMRKKEYTLRQLREQVPQLEATVPGLRYTALVPLAVAATFALNALVRVLWIRDGTAGVWLSVALAFGPIAVTVYLLSWEQKVQLARLKEVTEGPSGHRVADMRARFEEQAGDEEGAGRASEDN